jgi:PAS domain S-box-containing protein
MGSERIDAGAGETDEVSYRTLVEAVIDYAIYRLDAGGHVASWNAGAARIKGYRRDEIIGEHFGRFYTPEDRAAGLPARVLARAAAEGRFEGEGWRVRKDGSRFWAHVIVDPIREANGAIVGFAKVTRDLTEKRTALDELWRSEQQFRLLVQGVTDYAIYMLDPRGNVTSWNAGAERIKGYRADEIIGRHFSTFYTSEDRAAGEPQRTLDSALRANGFEKEGWRVRKDGSRFWASVVVDPVRDGGGNLLGFAKVTRDITERRAAQQELDRTRLELLQAQKMDAIGQLTGGVAHDFNNLLMAIVSSLELYQRHATAGESRPALLANAGQAAERGMALTQRMLAFARKQELQLRPVDLARLVAGMTELLRRALGPSVDIDTSVAADLPPVMADANQLELALLNLATNARDAMPDGGTLRIDARRAGGAPGDHVALTVTDTGTGMDEATLARAIEPFFTTKGVGKGTGLGLSMVHGVIEQLGGQLAIRSTPGVGTVVEARLPIAAPDGPLVARRAEPALAPPAAPAKVARRLTILAVDDDSLVLTNLATMLEDLGHEVLSASSGEDALAIWRRMPAIDLVVTDFAMPRMTGLQLAQAIKDERPDVPIILATGYAEIPVGGKDAIQRLIKPFSFADLEAAIDRAFARPPQEAALSEPARTA